MKYTFSGTVALVLAGAAWLTETRLILGSSTDMWAASAHVVIIATIALSIVPLLLERATGWNMRIGWFATVLIGGFVFIAVLDRAAKPVDSQVATVTVEKEQKARLEADLAAAKARLIDAQSEMKKEANRGGCGTKCQVWAQYVETHQAMVDRLNDRLGNMKPAVAYSPAKRFAALTGVSEDTFVLVLPALQPVAFQILIVFLLSYWHRSWFGAVSTVSEEVSEVSGGGGKANHEDHEVIALKSALRGGRKLTNDELAKYMQVGKGEASKRVAKAEALGLVSKVRTGKHVAISLAHAC